MSGRTFAQGAGGDRDQGAWRRLVDDYGRRLAQLERALAEERRRIREEQDLALARALEADRARERRRLAEQEELAEKRRRLGEEPPPSTTSASSPSTASSTRSWTATAAAGRASAAPTRAASTRRSMRRASGRLVSPSDDRARRARRRPAGPSPRCSPWARMTTARAVRAATSSRGWSRRWRPPRTTGRTSRSSVCTASHERKVYRVP